MADLAQPEVVMNEDHEFRDRVLGFLDDLAEETGTPDVSVQVAALECIANEFAYDAPRELVTFLRAFADVVEADEADEGFDAADADRVQANVALQLAVDKARDLPPVESSRRAQRRPH